MIRVLNLLDEEIKKAEENRRKVPTAEEYQAATKRVEILREIRGKCLAMIRVLILIDKEIKKAEENRMKVPTVEEYQATMKRLEILREIRGKISWKMNLI